MATRTYRSGSMASDTRDMISFWGYAQSTYYATFRQVGSTSGYVVPTAKNLIITRIVMSNIYNAIYSISMIYGTSDVGMNSASAPSGSVTLVGDGTTTSYSPLTAYQNNNSFPMDIPIALTVPASYYPAFRSVGTNGSVYIEGYLETA